MLITVNDNINAIPNNPLRHLFEQAAPGALNLASGHPAQALMDTGKLITATNKASQEHQSWRYGASKGDADLINLVSTTYGLTDVEDLVITAGAQQGIDLILRTLAKPSGILLVPEQVYPAALSTGIMNGLTPVAYRIAETDETLSELRALLDKIDQPCALYALPTFANPSSKTLSTYQRKHLLMLASEFDFPVIEDDPYRELWFTTPPPETLYTLNKMVQTKALVIYLGSFSKIISPGLRVGWMQGPKELLMHIVRVRQASDLQSNALAQRVVYHYLSAGNLEPHLIKLRSSLRAIHQDFIRPLHDLGFTKLSTEGGLFIMPSIVQNVTAKALCAHLLQENIIVVPGNAFLLNPNAPSNSIRLCFGALTQDKAEQAGMALANACRKIL